MTFRVKAYYATDVIHFFNKPITNSMKRLFLTLAACAALCACSKDDADSQKTPVFTGDTAYLNVRISDAATRASAGDPNEFENGSANEYAVSDAKFYFYDANEAFVTQASVWNGGDPVGGDGNIAFGLPGKGEMDPTTPMAIFYIFLFGLMLSDAAYGLIIFLACFILIRKFPRMENGLQKSLRLFMYCGISTLIWGILFGGFFGDLITVVSRTFFHHEVTFKPVWFAPLDDPMKLLLFSLLFGLIHLFGGLALKGYMCLKKGDAKSFICDVLSWFMLITGLVLMLMPTELFASIAQMQFNFPGWLKNTSYGLAIVGAAIIVLMSGRDHKNPVLRLALGLYDIYNLTGWLSDLLSYSRLLALGLATGVIAQVINQMGSMAGDGIFGAIVFVIVFIVGHLFNLAINMLGAYVHTCRLQYVEFFGKFYEGGGNPFRPFRENTKYVDIVSGTETQK